MKALLRKFILRAIDEFDGNPMTDQSLLDSVRMAYPGTDASLVKTLATQLGDEGYIAGAVNPLSRVHSWTLTDKGRHQINQP